MRTIRNLVWFLLALSLTVYAGLASAAPRIAQWSAFGPDGGRTVWVKSIPEACGVTAGWYTINSSTHSFVCGEISGADYWMNRTCKVASCGIGTVTNKVLKNTSTGRWWCEFEDKAPDTSKPTDQQCADKPNTDPPPASCKPGDPVDVTYRRGPENVADNDGYSPFYPNQPHDGACNLDCTVSPLAQVRECFSRAGSLFCSYTCVKNGNPKSSTGDADAPTSSREPTDPRKDVPPFDAPKGSCPKGTVNVGLNSDGVPRCQGTGTDPKNKPPAPPKSETEKTETAEDGTKTTTKTETITNADGSQTVVKTVTVVKPDGTKQTNQDKTTSDKPAGGKGQDDSQKDDEKYDLCKQNPNLTICKNSTVAGRCGEISCTGDAIQCATLRAAAAMQCQQQKNIDDLAASPLRSLGESILAGNDPQASAIAGALKGTEIDVKSQIALDESGFLGSSASCLRPITLTLLGRSVQINFDELCTHAQVLRYSILAVAYFFAFLIVARSLIGGDK